MTSSAHDDHPLFLAGSEAVTSLTRERLENARQLLSPSALVSWLDGAESIRALGRGDPPVLAWLDAMPQVARECGEDVLGDALTASMKLSSMTSGEVIAAMLQSLPDVARQLGDAELLRAYLAFLHRFASSAARGLRPMLSNMEELLSKLTLTGLKRWADFGVQAYRRDFNNLVAYFSLESADARAVLLRERRGVLLVREQRKLNLYLRALWGRDIFLRPLGADHLDVRAHIEYQVLHLPDAVDDIGDVPGLELYRAMAVHMAAHLVYTREAISAQELSPAHMFFIGMFEDARVEYLAAADFPGVGRLWRAMLSVEDEAGSHAGQQGDTTLLLLRRCALMLNDFNSSIEDTEICMLIERWHVEIDSRCHDVRLSWQCGIEMFNILAARRAVPSLRILESLPVPYRDDNRFVWAFDGLAVEGNAEMQNAGKAQTRRQVGLMELVNEVDNELADDDAEEIWVCADELHPYEDDLETTASFNEMWGSDPVSAPFHYPEWDYQVQLLRPDWVTLRERRQPRGDSEAVDRILLEHRGVSQRIRRIIDLLTPSGVERIHRLEDGDEIDLNAAIDAMIALRMGEQPSSRVTMRQQLNSRDLAVIVLMDLSESTKEPLRGSERTVLELTREAAALLASAIEGIGDSFAIHGFASDGRSDVHYYRFKDFSERYGDDAKARLAGMQGGLSTRMGAALRHAGHCLQHQRERRKLILLVTDGEPADIDERDPQHLRQDTKKAVEELWSNGVFTYCLTLDANADNYVRRIFGDSHYTIVDRVERLPEQLPKLFASLTG